MTYRAWIAAACVLLAGCASRGPAPGAGSAAAPEATGAQRRQMLFGWWVSRVPLERGRTLLKIALHCPDGVFFFDYRTLDAGGGLVSEYDRVGDWGLSGPVFFTITRGGSARGHNFDADLTQGRYYQAYRVLKLNYTEFRYRSYATGTVVSAHRASPDELSDLHDAKGAQELPGGCGGRDSGDSGN